MAEQEKAPQNGTRYVYFVSYAHKYGWQNSIRAALSVRSYIKGLLGKSRFEGASYGSGRRSYMITTYREGADIVSIMKSTGIQSKADALNIVLSDPRELSYISSKLLARRGSDS